MNTLVQSISLPSNLPQQAMLRKQKKDLGNLKSPFDEGGFRGISGLDN